MPSCVKPQANFYPLSKAVHQFNFPFTVQIIPTMCVPEFSSNKHHKVTLLSLQVASHNILITKRNNVTTSAAMSDDDVRVIPLDNSLSAFYHTIGDVIRSRKTDNGLQYVAVMSPCVYKDITLDIGDILHIQQPSKLMTLQRTSNTHLRCVILPENRRVTLPDHFQVQLRKCSVDVEQETRIQQLSDVAYSEVLPCLITFSSTFNVYDSQGYSLASETVLLTGKSVNNVAIGCHKKTESESKQDDIYIHTFPTNFMIDLEMLHGEQPVAEFSASDLQEIFEQIKDVEGIDKAHHKFNVDDLDLSDYMDVNLDKDVYENYDPQKPPMTVARDSKEHPDQQIGEALYEPINNNCSNRQQKTGSSNNGEQPEPKESSGYEVVNEDFTTIKQLSISQPNDESLFNNNNNSNFLSNKSFLDSNKTQLLADKARLRRNTVLNSQKKNFKRFSNKNMNMDEANESACDNEKPNHSGYEVNVIKVSQPKPQSKTRNSGYEVNEISNYPDGDDMYNGYEVSPFGVENNQKPPLPAKIFKNYENI